MNPALPFNLDSGPYKKGGVKILAVAGASGGHIFPALSFLDALKERYADAEVCLVLPKKSIKNQLEIKHRLYYISIVPIKPKLNIKSLVALYRFFKSCIESALILLAFEPDIVVGFGSISSLPVVTLATFFRIKTLIHEQNVIPGKANRFLSQFADRIAVSFEETKDHFKGCKEKVVVTGNLIRKDMARLNKDRALEFFGFSKDKITLLVMGGSQGSHKINAELLKTLSALPKRNKLQIIHLSGAGDLEPLKQGYKELDIDARCFVFLNSMQHAYSACDFVVSRAGATTIAEIMLFALPAILIPYPYAYQHQLNNARALERTGCAVIIPDTQLDPQRLSGIMNNFIDDGERLKNMRLGYNKFSKNDASKTFLEAVFSLN